MTFQIDCPNCGLRPVGEFRFGGPVQQRPKPDADALAWSAYLYNRPNRRGLEQEWWYHRAACKCWFLVERDTRCNHVVATRRHVAQEQADAGA